MLFSLTVSARDYRVNAYSLGFLDYRDQLIYQDHILDLKNDAKVIDVRKALAQKLELPLSHILVFFAKPKFKPVDLLAYPNIFDNDFADGSPKNWYDQYEGRSELLYITRKHYVAVERKRINYELKKLLWLDRYLAVNQLEPNLPETPEEGREN